MSATRSLRRLATLWLIAVGVFLPASAVAADAPPVPVSDNVLDQPVVDLALVARDEDPPDLLTLRIDELTGEAHVSLVRRMGTWEVLADETIAAVDADQGLARPWLVELGDGRFAVIAPIPGTNQTSITPISVTPTGIERPLIGIATTIDLLAVNTGAADVDGDGQRELVIAGPDAGSIGASCPDLAVQVLDQSTFARVVRFTRTGVTFGGGVIGEWDGVPGDDLLVATFPLGECPPAPATVATGLTAIRLADGTTIPGVPTLNASDLAVGLPLGIDVDSDGRDEALVRDGGSLVLLDPLNGWARTQVGSADPIPMFAGDGIVAWFEGDSGPVGGYRIATIERAGIGFAGTGFAMTVTASLDLGVDRISRQALMDQALSVAAAWQVVPPLWRGDVDGDGCPDLLAPLLTASCDGRASMREGALWLATRPIAVFDAAGSRKLLVAGTIDWDPNSGIPREPSPTVSGLAGAWRHGASPRFVLSELRAADIFYFSTYPVPRPTIDRIGVRDQATDVPGFTGARVLVRSETTRIRDRRSPVPPPIETFLTAPTSPGELVTVSRIAVPSGGEAGRDGSFVRVPLPDIRTSEGDPVDGWSLTISQLNDWGEIAQPVAGTVSRDTTGPSLSVEIPFLTPPWPWEATLRGRSETGALVSVGDGSPVETDRLGRFTLTTRLAPWPQSVEVRAVDFAGNATLTSVTVVGGVDYRLLPWPAIVAVILLVGASIGAARTGTGPGQRGVREVAPAVDDESLAEIEELPSPQHR